MYSIIRYISSMLPYMAGALPVYGVCRLIKYKKTKALNRKREVMLLFFVLFMVGLASQTIIPKFGFSGGTILMNPQGAQINLIPFKVIPETYRESVIKGHTNYFIINFLGNIIMFIPIGFFISTLWKVRGRNVIIIGAGISLFIEITQLFLPRRTDIDAI